MPSMYIAVDPRKRIITVEPSFMIHIGAAEELQDIHTISEMSHRRNCVSMSYTFGYEPHETLAVIIFTLVEQGLKAVPISTVRISGNAPAMEQLPRAIELAELMNTWARLAAEVQANEQLIREIDARAESYERDVRSVNLSIKYDRERLARSGFDMTDFYNRSINTSIAKRRLIATNKRCDPGRKAKAQHRLSELEVEIRNLRPAWRKLVRPELQQLV